MFENIKNNAQHYFVSFTNQSFNHPKFYGRAISWGIFCLLTIPLAGKVCVIAYPKFKECLNKVYTNTKLLFEDKPSINKNIREEEKEHKRERRKRTKSPNTEQIDHLICNKCKEIFCKKSEIPGEPEPPNPLLPIPNNEKQSSEQDEPVQLRLVPEKLGEEAEASKKKINYWPFQ